MGKHFLLLVFGLSLVVGFLQALKCLECGSLNSDGMCKEGRSTCKAKENQECSKLVIYQGYDIVFGQQGCSFPCLNNTFTIYNLTLEFTCCHNQSLCNEF